MRKIEMSNTFKKNLKKVSKYPNFRKSKFDNAIIKLQNNEPLDRMYSDHAATNCSPKYLRGRRILHVAPNICLIYLIKDDTIYLENIGSHQDTGLTEAYA